MIHSEIHYFLETAKQAPPSYWLEMDDICSFFDNMTPKGQQSWMRRGREDSLENRLKLLYCQSLLLGDRAQYSPEAFRCYHDGMLKLKTISKCPYDISLAVGEAYENIVVALLQELGFEADRYRQTDIPRDMLQALQTDIWLHHRDGSPLIVELKALRGGSWNANGLLVGSLDKWDRKEKDINICIAIHQDTNDVLWTPADSFTRDTKWLKHSNSYGMSYVVPISLWEPLASLAPSIYF